MKAELGAYAILSNSYVNIARCTLLASLPEKAFGGKVYRAIDLRGEYLKTAFMAAVESIASLIGMIFWAAATLVTGFSETCKQHFLAHLSTFIVCKAAIGVAYFGVLSTYIGGVLGSALLAFPFRMIAQDSRIQELFRTLKQDIANQIPEQVRPYLSEENVRNFLQSFRV